MPYDPNDPRLTAFALGELEDHERPAVEAQLEACAESRTAVEEIRAAARLLEDELRREASPGLAPEQRSAIEGRLAHPSRPAARAWISLALAASVLLCVGFAVRQSWPTKKPARGSRCNWPKPPPGFASHSRRTGARRTATRLGILLRLGREGRRRG